MKRLSHIILTMLMLVWNSGIVLGATVRPLGLEERALRGATHVVNIGHADLTETTANTPQTLAALFAVQAKMGVEVTCFELVTGFAYSTTNGFNSVALTVGDGADGDLYLTSTEINSEGSEVWLKEGRFVWNTATTGSFVTNVADTTSNFITAVTDTTSPLFVTNVTDTADMFLTNVVAATDNYMTNITLTTFTWTNYIPVLASGGGITNYVTSMSSNVYTAVSGVSIVTKAAVSGITTTGQYAVTATAIEQGTAVTATAIAQGTAVTGTGTTQAAAVTETTATESDAMVSDALSFGFKVYTADDFVDFTFTPSPAAYSLSQLDSGELNIYIKIRDAR